MAKMSFSKDSLTKKLVPGGIYTLHMGGFKPATSKNNPDNTNLNPQLKIVNNKDFTGKPVFVSLPRSEGWMIQDFVHALGQEMVPNPNGGADDMPGDWEFPSANPTTWRYKGPLLGKTLQAELVETEYQGKPQLKIKQFICAVKDCKTKYPDIVHSTNMVKG